jgi:hypothetical protein
MALIERQSIWGFGAMVTKVQKGLYVMDGTDKSRSRAEIKTGQQ